MIRLASIRCSNRIGPDRGISGERGLGFEFSPRLRPARRQRELTDLSGVAALSGPEFQFQPSCQPISPHASWLKPVGSKNRNVLQHLGDFVNVINFVNFVNVLS